MGNKGRISELSVLAMIPVIGIVVGLAAAHFSKSNRIQEKQAGIAFLDEALLLIQGHLRDGSVCEKFFAGRSFNAAPPHFNVEFASVSLVSPSNIVLAAPALRLHKKVVMKEVKLRDFSFVSEDRYRATLTIEANRESDPAHQAVVKTLPLELTTQTIAGSTPEKKRIVACVVRKGAR